MNYFKKTWSVFDNYVIARWQNRPSTALFWYLPEPPNLKTKEDLICYQQTQNALFYLIDYRQKLNYSLENTEGIIVLPYHLPIGEQINPEAAFQYALGLHDQFYFTKDQAYLKKFWHYANYFLSQQTPEGLWAYHFDWYGSKAPWYSALAQARGASVMLRAWLYSHNPLYLTATKNAIKQFTVPTSKGGFLHEFSQQKCCYFEEYPKTPTGVINGFMASLISLWELSYWIREQWLDDLWQLGINSLQTMLPFYSTGWWSLYDLDHHKGILNINSPRYHLLEIHYLQILSLLSDSTILMQEYKKRVDQYNKISLRLTAFSLKLVRKIIYK